MRLFTLPTACTQLCVCCCSSLTEYFCQQILQPETSYHVSYLLGYGLSLTLVAEQHGYTACRSPFSSGLWEAKMPYN